MGVSLKRSFELLPLLPVPQGEWTRDLEWLKEEIKEERLRVVKEGRTELIDLASDREALMVLSESSLRAPIHSEYVEIFMYLMTKIMGDRVPENLRRGELSKREASKVIEHLRRLKKSS